MRKPGIFALEAIDFQSNAFFDELSEACAAAQAANSMVPKDTSGLYRSKEVLDILKVINAHTGLNCVYEAQCVEYALAMRLPLVAKNHIFFDKALASRAGSAMERDAHALVKTANQKTFTGSIDMRTGKVSGIFSKIPAPLYIGVRWLVKGSPLSGRQLAAVLLHEVGHTISYYEFLSRSTTTNQVLAGLSRAMVSKEPNARKYYIENTDILKALSTEQRAALEKSTDAVGAVCIAFSAQVELSRTELGCNVYDATGIEWLADQYAIRCGAGRELTIGLSIIENMYPQAKRSIAATAMGMLGYAIFTFVSYGMFMLLHLCFELYVVSQMTYSHLPHGDPKVRYQRIIDEMVVRLKDRSITPEEKAQILADIAAINDLGALSANELNLLGTVAYYLKPEYRNRHKFTLLQQDLERMANNNLFVHAAKLSTLTP